MTACRTTGTVRQASATPAWSTRPTSSRRARSRRAMPRGAGSTRDRVSRSRWCRWPSSSRIRRACCAPATRTAPGRTAPSTRRDGVARGDRGRLSDLGLQSRTVRLPGRRRRRTATSFRKPRCSTSRPTITSGSCATSGPYNPDEAGNPLFQEGDRSRWFMLQPYLIALLMSKGMPMLWQGEEFAENYFLPDVGAGRVALLRPLRWDYFYDDVRPADRRPRPQAAAHPARARRTSAAAHSSSSTTGIATSRAGC